MKHMKKPWSRLNASLLSTIVNVPITASGYRLPMPSMSRLVNRKRCGKRRFIRKMTRVCRLIPNFASDSILCCKHFQENVNETRNAVNDVRKTVNLSSKTAVNHIRK